MAKHDAATGELFASVPQPASLDSPTMDLKVAIARAMGDALRKCDGDRYEIAARISRTLGRDVSKGMLDAYTAPSKDTHIPNLAFCIAFDAATGQNELLNLYARLRGGRALMGEDALRAELGRLEVQYEELGKQRRAIKNYLSRSKR